MKCAGRMAVKRPFMVVFMVVLSAALSASVFAVRASAGAVVEADDTSYYDEVVRSELPVILMFHADWCAACLKQAPVMDGLACELAGRVKVVRMKVEKSRTTASRYKVRSIPAFFYLEDGNVRGEAVGAMSGATLLELLHVPDSGAKR